jgi:hypothetical protein
LGGGAEDGKALGALGEWHAFERKCEWAVEVLERARRAKYQVDSGVLGECYWVMSREKERGGDAWRKCKEGAGREFGRARSGGDSMYLRLCEAAVKEAMGKERRVGDGR